MKNNYIIQLAYRYITLLIFILYRAGAAFVARVPRVSHAAGATRHALLQQQRAVRGASL